MNIKTVKEISCVWNNKIDSGKQRKINDKKKLILNICKKKKRKEPEREFNVI